MDKNEWLKLAEACLEDDDDSFFDQSSCKDVSKFICTLLTNKIEKKIEKVANYWYQMGLPKNIREQRVNEVIMAFVDLCEKIEKTESKSLNDLIAIKENKIKEINELTSDLGEQPYELNTDVSLLLLTKNVHFKCQQLRELKEIRMNEWNELEDVKIKRSHRLGIENKTFQTATNIPNLSEIKLVKKYVSELESSIEKRKNKLLYMRKLFAKLFSALERTMDNEFEYNVVNGDVNEFILSDKNLNRLDDLHSLLENEIQKNNANRLILNEKLQNLYDRLGTESSERIDINPNDSRPSTLKKIEAEIERLEILKKENMGLFICKLRPEIIELWNKCYVGSKHREYFSDYLNDTDFNDELLEIHEKEVDRLKAFYEENCLLISKLEAHREDWNRFRELDQKMRDPSRLNNRGGTLLKEENARKKLQKSIPKLEKEITELSKEWSESHENEHFTVFDVTIDSYFLNLWREFNEEKETEKKNRQLMKAEIEVASKGRTTPSTTGGRRTPLKRAPGNPLNPIPASGGKIRKLNPLSPNKQMNQKNPSNVRSKLDFNRKEGKSKANIVKPVVTNKVTTSTETFICEDEFQKTLKQRTDSFMNSTEC